MILHGIAGNIPWVSLESSKPILKQLGLSRPGYQSLNIIPLTNLCQLGSWDEARALSVEAGPLSVEARPLSVEARPLSADAIGELAVIIELADIGKPG